MLTFSCAAKDGNRLEKVRKLIKHALSFTLNEVSEPENSLSKVKIEASESNDQNEEDNKCNSDNDSAAKGGIVTNVPVDITRSNAVDLTMTSCVFPSSVVLVMPFTFSFSFSNDIDLLLVLVLVLVKMLIYF